MCEETVKTGEIKRLHHDFFSAARRANGDLGWFLVLFNILAGFVGLLFAFTDDAVDIKPFLFAFHLSTSSFIGLTGWIGLRRLGAPLLSLFRLNTVDVSSFLLLPPIIILYYCLTVSEMAYTAYAHALLAPLLGLKDRVPPFAQMLPFLKHPLAIWIFAFHIVIWGPLCEEVLFRGAMQRAYARISPFYAILGPSILFAVLHGTAMAPLSKIFMGAALGIITMRSKGSLVASYILHLINNLLPVLLVFGAYKASHAKDLATLFAHSQQQQEAGALIQAAQTGGMLLFTAVTLFLALLFIYYLWKNTKKDDETPSLAPKEGARILYDVSFLTVVFVSLVL